MPVDQVADRRPHLHVAPERVAATFEAQVRPDSPCSGSSSVVRSFFHELFAAIEARKEGDVRGSIFAAGGREHAVQVFQHLLEAIESMLIRLSPNV